MDAEEREQVGLILEHEGEAAIRATVTGLRAMHAEFSARGTFRSGATIKRTVEIIEETANAFVVNAIKRVSPVSRDLDAFALVAERLNSHFEIWARDVEQAVALVTGQNLTRMQSVAKAADGLFAEMKVRVGRELEIHRFTFLRSSKEPVAESPAPQGGSPVTVVPKAKPANSGGKPLAKHWDGMWAAIAVKLWTGDLQPKTQADLKQAMFDWFNNAEIEVGDTAVTERARQLWQTMQAERG